MDPLLLSLLQKAKLTDKQSRVYLAALELGEATISQIAEATLLKRTGVYSVVSELESLGYLKSVVGPKKKTYSAADPNKVVSELKLGITGLEEMLPYLRAIQKKANKPYVRYYHGVDAIKQAYSQIYRPKDARYLTSFAVVKESLPEEAERWQRLYLQGKARPGGKHLLTDTAEDRTYQASLDEGRQLYKSLPKGLDLKIDIALIDGDVFLTSFEDNSVHLTVIKSPALCDAMTRMYELAWEKLGQ